MQFGGRGRSSKLRKNSAPDLLSEQSDTRLGFVRMATRIANAVPPEGLSTHQTRVVAGSSLDETYSGTYSVNPNCTGSFTVLVEPDTRTSTVDLVWTDNTNGVSAVFTNPGFILTATARRISPRETD